MAKKFCAGNQDISKFFRPKTKTTETASEGLLSHDSDSDNFVEVNIYCCLMKDVTYFYLTLVISTGHWD